MNLKDNNATTSNKLLSNSILPITFFETWKELFTNPNISGVKNPIFRTSTKMLTMLAVVLQLLKRATPEHLSQEQKQPINTSLLRNHGPYLTPVTCRTSRQLWIQPHLRSPMVHIVIVLQNIFRNLFKLRIEIEL